jgi:5-methylcytosine-specific restriction endonuclease McrA
MSAADFQGKRAIAKQNGDKTYFTGVPCKHGHNDARYTSNAICVTCKHESFEKRYAKNKAKVLAESQAWKDSNRQRVNKYAEEYRALNPEQVKQAFRMQKSKNRSYYTAKERARQFAKMNATPSWLTPIHHAQIQEMYDVAVARTMQLGIPHEVDHIVPLTHDKVIGLHVPWNLQVLTASDNRRKSNHFEG